MYVILVYDVGVERVGKACKLCRRYLNWVQNSVFEGELGDARLARLKAGLTRVIDPSADSVLIYGMRTQDAVRKEVMGVEKAVTDNVL